jgi:hypothetical protein
MFDAVIYINLEHRLDRKELILNEIQKIKNIDEDCSVRKNKGAPI